MDSTSASAEVPDAARRRTDPSANAGETSRRLSLLRLMSPENLANPHVLYRELREFDPVHWDPYMHAWVITSYAEAVRILQECSAARIPAPAYLDRLGLSCMKPFAEMMQQQLMFMDGAMHSRLRSICSAAFTANRVQGLRSTIEKTVNDLLDKVADRRSIEMVGDLANPLPAMLTAKLLGVPVEDHAQLHAWVLDLAEVFGNFQHHPDRVSVITRSLNDLQAYILEQMR